MLLQFMKARNHSNVKYLTIIFHKKRFEKNVRLMYDEKRFLKCDFNRTNVTYVRYKLSIRITYQMYLISNIGQESYWSNLLLRV